MLRCVSFFYVKHYVSEGFGLKGMNCAILHVCQPAEGMWFTLHWPPVSHRQKLASLVLMGCRAEKERGGENVVGGLLMGVWRV